MTMLTAYTGARIFDGNIWHDDSTLLVRDGSIEAIVPNSAIGAAAIERLDGGMLVPGFVDLQVNGGGGVLLNDVRTVDGIRTICSTFLRTRRPSGSQE